MEPTDFVIEVRESEEGAGENRTLRAKAVEPDTGDVIEKLGQKEVTKRELTRLWQNLAEVAHEMDGGRGSPDFRVDDVLD